MYILCVIYFWYLSFDCSVSHSLKISVMSYIYIYIYNHLEFIQLYFALSIDFQYFILTCSFFLYCTCFDLTILYFICQLIEAVNCFIWLSEFENCSEFHEWYNLSNPGNRWRPFLFLYIHFNTLIRTTSNAFCLWWSTQEPLIWPQSWVQMGL